MARLSLELGSWLLSAACRNRPPASSLGPDAMLHGKGFRLRLLVSDRGRELGGLAGPPLAGRALPDLVRELAVGVDSAARVLTPGREKSLRKRGGTGEVRLTARACSSDREFAPAGDRPRAGRSLAPRRWDRKVAEKQMTRAAG